MSLPYAILFFAVVFLIASMSGQVEKLGAKGVVALGVAGLVFVSLVIYQQLTLIGVL